MISLFRRLRAGSLSGKKAKNYLLYAIGEILLIVIGILLAVRVSDWNTLRNERREEQLLLRQLRTEFQANKAQIQDKIYLHKRISASGDRLLYFIDEYEGSMTMDSLNRYLSWTLTAPTFDPSLGVTNDLINSGKLYLIQNDTLRHLVSGWSGNIEFAAEEEQIWLKIRDENYIPYLKKDFSYRNILHAAKAESSARAVMNFGGTYDTSDSGPSKLDLEANRIFSREELLEMEDQVSALVNLNKISITQMTELQKVAERILDLIREEIDAPVE